MDRLRKLYVYIAAGIVFAVILGIVIIALPAWQRVQKAHQSITAGADVMASAPAPFMHRPYYGSKTILQRTVSFVDHDKPWYARDGLFVRYDGAKWSGSSISSCSGGVNCYDGHNGYDLNLWFEPVLSTAPGTVIRAGWYNYLNHNDALGLWVAIDHGNGFTSAYGHLSQIMVSVGDKVGTQWQIGTSGTTGASTGPHLHMATYLMPYWQATDPFGWTGGGSDPNIVPDYYLWVDNPAANGMVPNLSANDSATYPGAVVVNDGDDGWSSTGQWQQEQSRSDFKGNMHWSATSSGDATATATWQPMLPADGYYEVGVYVDDNHASSSWASYSIYSADPEHGDIEMQHKVYLDQSHIGVFSSPYGTVTTGAQWISIGTYYFRKNMHGRVVLSNATGEDGEQLGADGVEFAPVTMAVQAPPPSSSSAQPTQPVQQAQPTRSSARPPQHPRPTRPTPHAPTMAPPPSIYRYSMVKNDTPSLLTPAATVKVNLDVSNTGNTTWMADGSGLVNLGYHWQDSAGHDLAADLVDVSNIGALPTTVPPGGSATISLDLHTPALAGQYKLVYDLRYQEQWFASLGANAVTLPVNIAPTVPRTYYFAEGYTGTGTSENLSLTNLAATPASVSITYYYAGKAPGVRAYRLDAQATRVLNINQEAGAGQTVSMLVRGDQPFVAERTMYTQKGGFVAVTDGSGAAAPSRSWYFAEGNTTFGWNTLLAVMNPGDRATTLTVDVLPQSGQPTPRLFGTPMSKTYTAAAHARTTIVLNRDFPDQQFGMAINAGSPLVVERAEYLVKSPRRGGSSVVGATVPQSTWYFGAGSTANGANESIVLANPSTTSATAQITYLSTNGNTMSRRVSIAGKSRIEISVNDTLKQALSATIIRASVPIVAERQDFFSVPVAGSTTVMGSDAAHTSWYMAQGDTSGGHIEALDLLNMNSSAAQVRVVYYLANGTPIIKHYTIAANAQVTVPANDDSGTNQASGKAIYATLPIIVQHTMFFKRNGVGGGFSAMAFGR